MSLKQYNKKRDFSSTLEPKGGKAKSTKKPIFVVQYHKARTNHYDLRLEYKGVLLSWAVPKGLSTDPEEKRLAVLVEDHPIEYANFSGIIPKGNYGAGSVEIFDSGTYLPSFDFEKGIKKGHLKFVLDGKKFKGEWSLVKIDEKNWLLIKSKDDFAHKTEKSKKSTLPFKICDVQLATLSKKIPSGKNWIYEIKYDGYRIISYVQNGKVCCLTRNGKNYTEKFPEIVESLAQIDESNFVVDGEVVAFDKNGKSDFGLLQSILKNGEENLNYVIFDLLALNGEDLRKLALKERKRLLNRLFSKERDKLILSGVVEGNGKKCFDFAKKNNLEGIMAKDINSSYNGKRDDSWLKIKCYLRQEFIICGFLTTSKNSELSALLLGYYQDKKLVYAGKVGTGFDSKERHELAKKLEKIKRKNSPFELKNLKANWVKPELVVEIQFTQLTKEKILRQPSYVGLREDKEAKNVVLEVPVEN